tara:strand:- start:405 stop:1178 length:774 start_codon:yes stop_codon:yes gene_type:complete
MALSDILKFGATILGGGGNPIASLATNFLLSKALGADTKDAVKYAGLGTLLGTGLGTPGLFGGKAEQMPDLSSAVAAGAANKQAANALAQAVKGQKSPANIAQGIASIEPAKGTLGIAPFLAKAGVIDPQGGLASLLNTVPGEAGAVMLASLLADQFSSDDEDPARRPFGGVEGFVDINIPKRLAAGGTVDGQYFPRRNGGIMPSEGSGQKDDVPAMLMAGEFVLNKKAVKGLGNGDLNKGIERAYAMQNRLESQGA